MSEPLRGGCLCGSIRWELAGRLTRASNCHCSMCRKQHGAAFGSYAAAKRAELRWVAGEAEIARYEATPGIARGFCRRCGSTLFWDERANAEHLGLALGSVDGDPGVRPGAHIFVGSKAPWFEITDALPQHETIPRAS